MAQQKTSIIKYMALPGILPRFVALFASGFYTIAYSLAVIFASVRLLPANHPYLDADNIGKYGARHVYAAAAHNLDFQYKNIDQIIIYFLMLLGAFLMVFQIILLIMGGVMYQPVFAQTFFSHPVGEEQDIAMILFDHIFGISGFFNSCVSTGAACTDLEGNAATTISAGFPFPIHAALHQMLSFYSLGLFTVAVFIILYFISVIVGETAAEGKVLGQRYNKTWVPVRLILFFGLLIPISNGLNAAQLLTFHVAKAGSNFASNAWSDFNTTITGQTLTGAYDLLATPNVPELDEMVQLVYLAKVCKMAEESHTDVSGALAIPALYGSDGIAPYLVRPTPIVASTSTADNAIEFLSTDYASALDHVQNGQITLVIGSRITDSSHSQYSRHTRYQGNVRPMCGTLVFETQAATLPGTAPHEIQKLYYNIVKDLWNNASLNTRAYCVVQTYRSDIPHPSGCSLPDQVFFTGILSNVRQSFKTNMENLIDAAMNDAGNWDISTPLKAKGWAGAAAWFNQIAELNGAVTSSVFNLPMIKRYPFVMELVATKNEALEENTAVANFDPSAPELELEDRNLKIATILYHASQLWGGDISYDGVTSLSGNFFLDSMNAIFGSSGIFDLLENPDINPLAQLTSLGRSMMAATLRNVVGGFGGRLFGRVLGNFPGELVTLTADFFQAVGYAALAIAFTLSHVLPLMPFIYFFFAVGGWIKGIFEAIVAMPLWALGHITRWDGDGVVGEGATNGYFLLFEIFLRPIMILFGLFASISIFSAMVMVLNDVFVLAVGAVGGFNYESGSGLTVFAESLRGPLDELFYTALYTIICYMMATSCFKLIDAIPNQIMRWMNFTIKTFQETTQNAAEQLSGQIYKGANISSSKLGGQALSGSQLHGLISG